MNTYTLKEAIALAAQNQHLVGKPMTSGSMLIDHVVVAPANDGLATKFKNYAYQVMYQGGDVSGIYKLFPDSSYQVQLLGLYRNMLLHYNLEDYLKRNPAQ